MVAKSYTTLFVLIFSLVYCHAERRLLEIHGYHAKPQEFKSLLSAPLTTVLQDHFSDYSLQISQIRESKAFLINQFSITIITHVEINKSDQGSCEIRGMLDLIEMTLSKTSVKCENARRQRLTFLPENEIVQVHLQSNFNVSDHFRIFWEAYGPSKAAVALDDGNYNIMSRYKTFFTNLVRMSWMNALERGSAVYGITAYSDLSYNEFNQFYTMQKGLMRHLMYEREFMSDKTQYKTPFSWVVTEENKKPPKAFDWRDKNAVTEVKNQGMCGSCWSFSTTGNIEGVHAAATGELLELSEQELVDCDTTDQGCNGGLMDNAFDQIIEIGGLESEDDYAYKGKQGKCKFDKKKVKVTITGHVDVPKGDEKAMQHQLLRTGPLAVALNAMWMQFYRGGVSHPWRRLCSPEALDHGVLIVGYGVEPADPDHFPTPKKEQPFWIIKNSWGPGWGESGYYRLYRGDGTCGIDQYATTATV